MSSFADRSRLLAMLGPTNTGKTHFAIERMLGHASGMIGFPLRLLARENYDRIVRLKGRGHVALITGEEKIVPPNPRWFVCTVESMPLDRLVDFLAVDEIQLAADHERGHVFTQRLLKARGQDETLFLGADTIRPLMKRLVPEVEILSRPRFSSLSYTGPRKLTRLPPRSAVVAFSATDVYHLAELMRRQRGGTAVVLGALSPRTRNAQVAMFQAGEVDYLVATDAIGMGLNMDVDHVAFARLSKFDGAHARRLKPAEIAQIAGRAGRHMADGTFGVTDQAEGLEPEVVEAVENHQFEPLASLIWRNDALDFGTPERLLRSLERPSPAAGLRRAAEADDQMALSALIRDPDVAALARNPARTRLLWDICQIPDYRKTLSDAHTRLLGQLFRQIAGPAGRLDTDWVAAQVARLDRTDGDIDGLVVRIAHVRTWTYVSHRGDWLADPRHWQERTRAIEDRLSDALHERLTQRFVDRRSALLVRTMKRGAELVSAVTREGEVLVEGHHVGWLTGFSFAPDTAAHPEDAKALASAARRALGQEIRARVARLEAADDDAFALNSAGEVTWLGHPVAKLVAGGTPLAPRLAVLASDLVQPAARDRIQLRLQGWLAGLFRRALLPLFRLGEAPLSGPARGIAFQLVERLGAVPRAEVRGLVDALTPRDRADLTALGVTLGGTYVYLRTLLKPEPLRWRALAWTIAAGRLLPAPVATPGAAALPRDQAIPAGFWAAIGYVPAATRAVRIDRLEALAGAAARARTAGRLAATPELARIVGVPAEELGAVLGLLGYRPAGEEGVFQLAARRPRRRMPKARAGSAFAKLGQLKGAS